MAKLDILEKYGPKAEHAPKHLKGGFVYRDSYGNETVIEVYDRTRALCHLEWLRLWTSSVFPPSTAPA